MTVAQRKKRPRSKARKTAVGEKRVPEARSEPAVVELRRELQLTQAEFARLVPVSVRSLATLESGSAPSDAIARRVTELKRLMKALSEVIRRESLGPWLTTPNQAFDGLKPLEVIERGESDRLWQMVYLLRSGVAS